MNTRQRYPSDLTDLQWDNIEHLFPQARGQIGRPRTYPLREIVNAALYLARSGCSWRMLPHDFPPWKTVSYYFYTWQEFHSPLSSFVRARTARLGGRGVSATAPQDTLGLVLVRSAADALALDLCPPQPSTPRPSFPVHLGRCPVVQGLMPTLFVVKPLPPPPAGR